MNIGFTEIIVGSTLLTSGLTLYKLIFGQGKAKAREENYGAEIHILHAKDKEFDGDIRELKDNVNEIKLNQEVKHSELKQDINKLEINILKELRKTNGH